MKITIVSLSMVTFVSLCAIAQPYGRGMGPANAADLAARNTDFMTSHLELSEDQKPVIDSINFVYAEKMLAVRQANRGDRDLMVEEASKVRDAHHEALATVLSSQQMSKLQEVRGRRRNQGGGRMGRGGPPGSGRSLNW